MRTYMFFFFVVLGSAASLHNCNRPLGMESGLIIDNQLAASSSFDPQSTGPQHARIRSVSGSGAWCPRNQINATSNEWIQVEFSKEKIISAVETQGRYDDGRGVEFPIAYMIEYWRNSLSIWQRYKDSTGNEIIPANNDTNSAVIRNLDTKFVANIVRIIPVSEFTRTVCLRFEIYGCNNQPRLLIGESLETDPLVDENSLTYVSVNNDEVHKDDLKWVVIGILAASSFGILSLAVLLYLLFCTRQILHRKRMTNPKSSYFSPGCQRNITMSVHSDSAKRYVTPPIPYVYQNRYDSEFIDRHHQISTSTSSDSSDYAEPDCESLSEPLIKMCSSESKFGTDSIHYASASIADQTLTLEESTTQPLSSFERFSSVDRMMDIPIMEFNSKALRLLEHIGNGEFGRLDVCMLEGNLQHVFVKYTSKSEPKSLKGFEREKKALSQLYHQNLCNFYGTVDTDVMSGSVFEFPAQGDLPNWVQRQGSMSQEHLLSISTQISAAVSYLESIPIVHRDLSSRNCFVDANGTIKLTDIAILNPAYSDDYYRLIKSDTTQYLPIRWMAYESLTNYIFTSKSDSWSLSVTIWEVFNMCRQRPYSHLNDLEVLENLKHMGENGDLKYKLECPQHCPIEIYDNVLSRCWLKEPNQRPSNSEIHRQLQKCMIEFSACV